MNYKVLDGLQDIAPGNKSLEFIVSRVKDVKYRGVISSQHNRYTLKKIYVILSALNSLRPNKSLLRIRTTDISKRPANLVSEFDYAQMCDEIKKEIGIGTQDALRKNIYVDLHRMGLIERYDRDGKPIDSLSARDVVYVSSTDMGIRFVEASPQEQHFIFSKALNNFMPGYVDILINLLSDESQLIKKITPSEFMYFVSAVNSQTTFNITVQECYDLIVNFNALSIIQRKAVDDYLKDLLKPENFEGEKPEKRDFGNWKNKADQIFKVLSQSVFFDINNGNLVLTKKDGIFEGSSKKLLRSLEQKSLYYKMHGVKKILGFELHHLISLSHSEDLATFKALDFWQNMLYIDGYSHNQISQNGNKNIKLSAAGNDLALSDFDGGVVKLINQRNVYYKFSLQPDILEYNSKLINGLKITNKS